MTRFDLPSPVPRDKYLCLETVADDSGKDVCPSPKVTTLGAVGLCSTSRLPEKGQLTLVNATADVNAATLSSCRSVKTGMQFFHEEYGVWRERDYTA